MFNVLSITMRITAVATGIMILLAGCTIPQRVRYSLDDEHACQGGDHLPSLSISVLPFEDVRRAESKEKDVLFKRTKNDVNCANVEHGYVRDSVAFDISQMIATQLEHDWCYKRVYFGNNDAADFYVTGKIVDFYGATASNATDDSPDYCGNARSDTFAWGIGAAGPHTGSNERGGVQFGMGPGGFGGPPLIGTPNYYPPLPAPPSRFITRIIFGDVKIFSRKKVLVKRFPAVVNETSEVIPGITHCSEIFPLTHAKLKLANIALAGKISKAVEEFMASDGKAPAQEETPLPAEDRKEKLSTIIFYNGETGKGFVDGINEKYVVYRKGKYENQISIMKRNVRAVITDGDTLVITK